MRPIILTAIIVLFLASPVAAQPKCFPVKGLFDTLAQRFQERPVWMGMLPNGNGVSILFHGKSGAWTLIQAKGSIGCIIATGSEGRFAKKGEEV